MKQAAPRLLHVNNESSEPRHRSGVLPASNHYHSTRDAMSNVLKALLLAAAGGAVYLFIQSRRRAPFPPPIRPDVAPASDAGKLTVEEQERLLRELASQL